MAKGTAQKAGAKRKTGTTKAAAPKAAARKATPKKGRNGASAKAAEGRPAAPSARKAAAAEAPSLAVRRSPAPRAKAPRASRKAPARGARVAPSAEPKLSEEDQIRSAKYLPRDLPPRLFEEERFLFPETYGVNRVRLLVKDPDWLFAHWDVDPKTMGSMTKAMGERAMALSRLTLRVVDPANGGSSDILLPPGARGWYIRADEARRAYRAELGVTLPSGEFRRLAESNVVVTPRVGPSRERASRRITFGQAGRLPKEGGRSQREAEIESAKSEVGPWQAASVDGQTPAQDPTEAGPAAGGRAGTGAGAARPASRGGASDVFRPGGASDVHRR